MTHGLRQKGYLRAEGSLASDALASVKPCGRTSLLLVLAAVVAVLTFGAPHLAFADDDTYADALPEVAWIDEETGDTIYAPDVELVAQDEDTPTASATITTGYTDVITGDFAIYVSQVSANFDISQVAVSVRYADQATPQWFDAGDGSGASTVTVPLLDWGFAPGLYIIQVHVLGTDGQDVVVQTRGKNVTNGLVNAFQIISDLQLEDDNTDETRNFASALAQIATVRSDAIIVNGDLVENSTQDEYDLMWKYIDRSVFSRSHFTFSAGNHELRTQWGEGFWTLHDRFLANVGRNCMYYETTVAGQPCLILGTDVDPDAGCVAGHYSTSQIQWLKSRLDYYAAQEQVVFVFTHHPIVSTVEGSNLWQWGGIWPNYLENSDGVRAVLDNYRNAIVFSSHTHYALEDSFAYNQSLDCPVYINTAAIAYLCNDSSLYFDGSQGLFVYEFEDRIIIHAYDFMNKCWLPLSYTYYRSRAMEPEVVAQEYSGADRYEVSAMTANDHAAQLNERGGAVQGLIVVSGENDKFADALSAAGLAGVTGYPVVVVCGTGLTDTNRQALQAYADNAADTLDVIIIGGEATVTPEVEEELAGYGTSLQRISGADRYVVNQEVYAYAIAWAEDRQMEGWNPTYAVMAKGNDFPDALTIAPFLAANATPIVLVDSAQGSLTEEQTSMLSGASQAVVLGGLASVPEPLYGQAASACQEGAIRLSGADRYDASAAIVSWELQHGMTLEGAGFATGAKFPDALSCVSLLASSNSVLCLVSPNLSANATMVQVLMGSVPDGQVDMIRFFGGTASVPTATRYQVRFALEGILYR